MLHRFLTTLLLASLSQTALARGGNQYAFDIILFENLPAKQRYLADIEAREFLGERPAAGAAEQSGQSEAVEAPQYHPDNTVLNYRPLQHGELDKAYETLQRAPQYQVLARKTWQQSALSDGAQLHIDINSEENSQLLPEGLLAGNTENSNAYLSGQLTLTFSRYIHLDTTITLHHGVQNTDTKTPYPGALRPSHIYLQRKMRSNETQYIDHPLVGVLVSIKRLPKQTGEKNSN